MLLPAYDSRAPVSRQHPHVAASGAARRAAPTTQPQRPHSARRETIALKSMAKDPGRRYGRASELPPTSALARRRADPARRSVESSAAGAVRPASRAGRRGGIAALALITVAAVASIAASAPEMTRRGCGSSKGTHKRASRKSQRLRASFRRASEHNEALLRSRKLTSELALARAATSVSGRTRAGLGLVARAATRRRRMGGADRAARLNWRLGRPDPEANGTFRAPLTNGMSISTDHPDGSVILSERATSEQDRTLCSSGRGRREAGRILIFGSQ